MNNSLLSLIQQNHLVIIHDKANRAKFSFCKPKQESDNWDLGACQYRLEKACE